MTLLPIKLGQKYQNSNFFQKMIYLEMASKTNIALIKIGSMDDQKFLWTNVLSI